jgi:hypothetical protein
VREPSAERGYRKLFLASVTQADRGVDFDFLRAAQITGKVPRMSRRAAPEANTAGRRPEDDG